MSYFLAIDAGGSRTQCLLADETRVLARADNRHSEADARDGGGGERPAENDASGSCRDGRRIAGADRSHLLRAGRDRQPRRARVGQQRSPEFSRWRACCSAATRRSHWMRPSREGPGYWSSRAPDRTQSAARRRARPSGRAAGGLCWATRDRAPGSAWKQFARHCAHTTANSLAIHIERNPHRPHSPAARDRAALEVGLARRTGCLRQPTRRSRPPCA